MEKEVDNNYNESVFDWIKSISSSLNLPLSENTIEEKILYTFLLTNPGNIAVRLDTTDDYYTTIAYQKKVNLGHVFTGKNTLTKTVGSIIFYYNLKLLREDYIIEIISNVNVKDLTKLFPLHYNPSKIKNVYLDNNSNMTSFYGDTWNDFIYQVNNYITFNYFPLLSKKELPVIYQFVKDERNYEFKTNKSEF